MELALFPRDAIIGRALSLEVRRRPLGDAIAANHVGPLPIILILDGATGRLRTPIVGVGE